MRGTLTLYWRVGCEVFYIMIQVYRVAADDGQSGRVSLVAFVRRPGQGPAAVECGRALIVLD
jgi:hypothetical protein